MQEHAEDIRSRPLFECPACGHALREGETVCVECGAQVRKTGHVPMTSAPKDERKT